MAYVYSIDKFTGAMIGILSSKPLFKEDEDYAALISSTTKLAASPSPLGEHVLILEVKADVPPPSALWRKKFASVRDQLDKPMSFFLVSPNAIIRGVVTAVNWVNPPKMGTSGSYASIEDAIVAVEQRLGQRLPTLTKLHEELLSRAR